MVIGRLYSQEPLGFESLLETGVDAFRPLKYFQVLVTEPLIGKTTSVCAWVPSSVGHE